MEVQLMLAAFIVSSGFSPILPEDRTREKTITSTLDGDSTIQENFRHFFDSITKNDPKKAENYRLLLEEGAAKGQEAFETMKEQLQSARPRNAHRRRNFHNEDSYIALSKRETSDQNRSPQSDNTTSIASTTPVPQIDLREIGYNGTWDSFCDPEEIDREFPLYPERELHELRIMRIVLCEMKKNNSISRATLPAFAAYKYCVMMRPQAETMLKRLFDTLSGGEPEKREILMTRDISDPRVFITCFNTAENEVKVKCIHERNAYFRMFRPLLARACSVGWLKTEEIVKAIDVVCRGRYMSGQGIEWNAMVKSINFTDGTIIY